nr:4'-phosphopantetheinyl transferase superfamily protein [Pleionea sp. CnH1-48]
MFKQLQVAYPHSLDKAVTKRKAEFLAGRYVAQQALKELCIEVEQIAVGPSRNPLWPTEVVGAITHTHQRAFAAVALKQHIRYLGLDHEIWIESATAKDIKSSLISTTEEDYLNTTQWPFERGLTLLFSAKESLFKALFIEVGRYFDFLDAELQDLCFNTHTFTLKLTTDLTPQLVKGRCFAGRFQYDESSVQTLIAIEP